METNDTLLEICEISGGDSFSELDALLMIKELVEKRLAELNEDND